MATQTVIVTGASRGLGAAVARLLAQMGAQVVLTARSEDDLIAVADSIEQAGGQAVPIAGDITDPGVCERLVEVSCDVFGQLDAIVNNAGILEPLARIAEADKADWERNLSVNVIGPVLLAQAALPHLRTSQGRVINVSSGAAIHPKTAWGAYCTAKAALNAFTGVLAEEESDVTALAVRPGIVDTEMQAVIREKGGRAMTDKDYQRFVGHYENNELRPPELPGRALAVLALHAPHDWSGAFIEWNEERVNALVDQFAAQA